jgi:hypothetical protein
MSPLKSVRYLLLDTNEQESVVRIAKGFIDPAVLHGPVG